MVLEIRNLWVHYGKVEALKGISLQIDEGEIITLIGSNGAGKSTTLRTISGLTRPTSGEILFHGRTLLGLPPHRIARMGIAHIPEGRRVFAPMTVYENLEMGAFPLRDKGGKERSLEEIYTHFPILRERRGQKAGSLSGGEQQMLAIARALMSQPRLILMDEPSMGLAPIMVGEVSRIIREIHQRGLAIILIEQNAHMALTLASRVNVLEVGEIILQGQAEDLMGNELVRKAYLGG